MIKTCKGIRKGITYKELTPDELKIYNRKARKRYYILHRQQVKEAQKKYYLVNKDKLKYEKRRYARKYYYLNKKQIQERRRLTKFIIAKKKYLKALKKIELPI